MPSWLIDIIMIVFAVVLVVLNGFFVATEFALVKVRATRVKELVKQRRPFAKTGLWLLHRLDQSLSACQLGITMASLGLGWLGEPAFAHMLRPLLNTFGITSEVMIHTIAFVVAFTIITAAHLVLGEQAPKIFAIRRPEAVLLWCALPMKVFYILLFPFLVLLNSATAFLLGKVGIKGAKGHDSALNEGEIRVLLSEAHLQGELTRTEHRLLNAVFEFDDTICRGVMLPRSDVVFFDINQPLSECLKLAQQTKHSRYPLCEGSLDKVLGVIHIKDLVGTASTEKVDLLSLARPPHRIPETMPISRLLRHFQASRHHLAFVIDEHGTVVGIITLDNVIERIIGDVGDEFDVEVPDFVPETANSYIVQGSVSINEVNRKFKLNLEAQDVDTLSGLLTTKKGQILQTGDRIELEGVIAEILHVTGERAAQVRVTVNQSEDQAPSGRTLQH
ncbi:hemolysin family protein [Planctomycetota bacterium]